MKPGFNNKSQPAAGKLATSINVMDAGTGDIMKYKKTVTHWNIAKPVWCHFWLADKSSGRIYNLDKRPNVKLFL